MINILNIIRIQGKKATSLLFGLAGICIGTLCFTEKELHAQVISNSGSYLSNPSGVVLSGGSLENTSGTINNAGDISLTGYVSNAGTLTAGAGTITAGGNWSNTGSFNANTGTVVLNGNSATTVGPTNFNNLTISGTGVKNALGALTINGNFNLNSGSLAFSSTTGNNISIGGNYTQTGGIFDFNTSTSGTSQMILGGNLTQTSGTESMTTSGAGALNGVIIFNGSGTQTLSLLNPTGAIWVVYSIPSGKYVRLLSNISLNSANGVTQAGFQGEINTSGTFDLGTYVVNQAGGVAGTAVFKVNSGANLITSNSSGLSGSISSLNMTTSLSSGANYEFRGASTGGFVTSPLLNTVNNLLINSSSDVALTNSLAVAGQLQLTSGKFTLGANTLTIAGVSPTRATGTLDVTNPSATLAFTNPAAITLPAGIFTGSINNLTVNGPGGITANNDLTVHGVLNLQSSNPSAVKGSLDMSNGALLNTLTMGPASSTVGAGDVTGIVKRNSFVNSTDFSFGNQFTTMRFTPGGTLPSEIGVKITLGTAPSWKSDAIYRSYDVIHTGGISTGVSFNLHYLDSELSGNPEADLFVWDYTATTNPPTLEKHARTGFNSTNNWISTSLNDIGLLGSAYGEHPWTLAKSVYVTMTGTRGWRMITSPTRTTCSDLLTGFISQGVPGSNYPGKQPNFLWFDETDTLTTNMSWRTSSFNGNLVAGRGYYLYVFDSVSGIYSDKLPRQMTTYGDAYFPGSFSFSGLNQPVTYTPRVGGQVSQSPNDTVKYDTNTNDQGWNLLGNPTLYSLDWDAPQGWTKTNIDNTIYIWDPSSNQFRVWNGTNGTLGNGLISPFQAFWIKSNNSSPALGFTQDVFASGGTFYGGSSTKSGTITNAPSAINLSLNAAGLNSDILITFGDDGKAGPDSKDAYRLEPLSSSWVEFFTLSSPEHNMPLVINNQPADGPDCIILPLYTGAQHNGREFGGEYTVNWELPSDWPSDWAISLNDHASQKAISMRKEQSYTFSRGNTKSSGSGSAMKHDTLLLPGLIVNPVSVKSLLKSSTELPPFSIVIQKGTKNDEPAYIAPEPSLLQNYPNPFSQTTTIRFSLQLPSAVSLNIYDIQGHRVDCVTDDYFQAGFHKFSWNRSNVKPGIYLLQMNTSGSVQTKKLVITAQ
jgi:hypothetical protein